MSGSEKTFTSTSPARLGQVEQLGEGVGVGDLEVVGGEDADDRASLECVGEVTGDQLEARLHDEADEQIDAVEAAVSKQTNDLALHLPVVGVVD